MLTLQLFKIMDRIWQNEGLDLGFVLSELQKNTQGESLQQNAVF